MTLVSFQCDCILVCKWQIVTGSYTVTGSYWQLLGSSRKMVPYYWQLQLLAVIHTSSTIPYLRYTYIQQTNIQMSVKSFIYMNQPQADSCRVNKQPLCSPITKRVTVHNEGRVSQVIGAVLTITVFFFFLVFLSG